MSSSPPRRPFLRPEVLGKGALLVAIGAVLLLLLSRLPVFHTDLYYFFRPAVQNWMAGQSPYEVPGYVNPPWTLILTLPFALVPLQLGQGLLFLFSATVIILSVRAFRGRRWMLLAALLAPPTLSLLGLGQLDAWVLVGLLLGRWAISRRSWAALGVALALVSIKPQVGGLVILLWLLTLPWSLKLPALGVLGGIWLLSCLMAGTWWPFQVNMLSYFHNPQMDLSTLGLVAGVGAPIWLYPLLVIGMLLLWGWQVYRHRLTDYTLALSLLVGSLCAPYVARHSLSLNLATAFVLVARRSPAWAAICYLLTWVPVLSFWITPWQGWWEAGAWWVLLGALVTTYHSDKMTKEEIVS